MRGRGGRGRFEGRIHRLPCAQPRPGDAACASLAFVQTTGTISKPQLADLVLAAGPVAERARIAAFLRDEATAFASNPFAATSAGAARHTWSGQAFEFRVLGVAAAGLSGLLEAVGGLPPAEPLVQEIVRNGPHTCCVLLDRERTRVVGAVLYAKPGIPLPDLPPPTDVPPPTAAPPARPARLARIPAAQLDLFA